MSACSFVESDSDSVEFSESGFSFVEFNLNEAVNGRVVSEEFFQNEFDNFMGSFPPSNL